MHESNGGIENMNHLYFVVSFCRTLIASITINPAMMAFVVATACTIFPAIPLDSKRLCKGMPNEEALIFAAAVTNSTAN